MFEYSLPFVPSRFIVFGCGGTGSRLVPLMAQFIKSCIWLDNFKPEITLVDFDTVEHKNLSRQNFVERDVGKNKAEVLAERYAKAYKMNIKAFPFKVSKEEKMQEFSQFIQQSAEVYTGISNTVIFMCVDTISARKEILQVLSNLMNQSNYSLAHTTLVVDTGNESDFGQVKLVGLRHADLASRNQKEVEALPKLIPIKKTLDMLPFDYDYFLGMKEPEVKLSCADLDQTMAINTLVATTAFSVLQNILYRKPIPYHRLNVSLYYGTQADLLTVKYLHDSCVNAYKYDVTDKSHLFNFSSTSIFNKAITSLYADMKGSFPNLFEEVPKEKVVKTASKSKSAADTAAELL